MAYKIQLFLVLVLMGTIVFYMLKGFYHKLGDIEAELELGRIKRIWYFLIALGMFSPNIFVVFLGVIYWLKKHQEKIPEDRIYLFFMVILILPNISYFIGAGGTTLIELSILRLLSLVLLVPLLLKVYGKVIKPKGVQELAAILLFLWIFIISFRQGNVTVGLRSILSYVLDVVVPYYFVLYFVDNLEKIYKLLRHVFAALAILSLVGIFESIKGWVLYNTMFDIARYKRQGGYTFRSGFLRSITIFPDPITHGYAMIYTLGLYQFQSLGLKKDLVQHAFFAICIFGVFFPISRGAWFGGLLTYLTYVVLSRHAVKKLFQFASFFLILGVFVLSIGLLDRIVAVMPFLADEDSQESSTIDYRGNLFDNAVIVIKRNLWTGSEDYLQTPEMQSMVQGQGIIDLVNTYVIYALDYGIIGLGLFVTIFVASFIKIYFLSRRIHRYDDKAFRLGNLFMALIVGIMFLISTMNTLYHILYLYWMLFGLCAAYIRIVGRMLRNPSKTIDVKSTSISDKSIGHTAVSVKR